jgi:uncharacterized protein (DUF488 family)
MKIFTIGFTRKPAEVFFTRLQRAGVKRLADIRLNNLSQLAGFAKRDDLRYFCGAICGIDYLHLQALAPTREMLDTYRTHKGGWDLYARQFLALLSERRVEETISREILADTYLFAVQRGTTGTVHRRLAAEYLQRKWDGMEIEHIL